MAYLKPNVSHHVEDFELPRSDYRLIYCDPPWEYYGDQSKDQACGKHYGMVSYRGLAAMNPLRFCSKTDEVGCLMWFTSSHIATAVDLMRAWGFHVRGTAFDWVKCKRDGTLIGARGVIPTWSKPTSEQVLLGTTCKRGRFAELLRFDVKSVQDFPCPLNERGNTVHSAKPEQFYELIESMVPAELPKIELFARKVRPGWDSWGNQLHV